MISPSLALTKIFTGASASLSNRWSRCDFLDKEIFAHATVKPQYWPGFGLCRDLPGLDPSTRWDGILSFYGHLMGFQGSTVSWSDTNDFTNFIPVAATIQNVVLTLANNLTQLAPGVESGWIFVNESTAGMVAAMFVRIEVPPYYNFYTVNAVALTNGVTGTSANFLQTIPSAGTGIIFTQKQVTWASATTTPGATSPATADTIGFIQVKGSGQPLQVIGQSGTSMLVGVFAQGFTAPAINASITLPLISNPGWQAGDYISLGGDGSSDVASTCLDIYRVQSVTPAILGSLTNLTSSLTSASVTCAATVLPASFTVGSTLLGQTVTGISGTSGSYTIALSGDANAALSNQTGFYSSLPTVTITRQGIGTSQLFAYPTGTSACTQPYASVSNPNSSVAPIQAASTLVEAYALKLTLENLTGIAPAGVNFIGGTQILSLNANEAGQLVNAGDRINGPVWAMTTSGVYAVIMKERSFQSMQYVGLPSIFSVWPEFTDEGLLGRNTWCKVGENTIYFWGHRAFFQWQAGQGDPTPIGQKQFVQVLSEIDMTRASEACMFHKEDRREVWFVYPVADLNANSAPSRVFIYNYEQGSISVDDYADAQQRITQKGAIRISTSGAIRVLQSDNAVSPITAVGSLPVYTDALQWQNWQGTWQTQLMAWDELVGDKGFLTLMALYPGGTPGLVCHGQNYDRAGAGYYSGWETVYHDCGDEAVYKYLDLVKVSLAVKQPQVTGKPFNLYVQVGARENFDGATNWSSPQALDCSGNANYASKLNFRMAGRFLALRFYSTQASCQWRIASYELYGRLGGSY